MSSFDISQDDILYSPELVQQSRNGVFLLIDPSAPNWVSVNRLGSAIIRSCDGRKTLRELAEEMNSRFRVNSDLVASFIRLAAEAGVISNTPSLMKAYPGRAQAIAPAALEEL